MADSTPAKRGKVRQSASRRFQIHSTLDVPPSPMLRCNACWLRLSDRAYATQCSHILCHDCSSKAFSRGQSKCPICPTNLDANGLAVIDLTPSSEKIKALCGLDPSFILQVASRAIDFYNFQANLAQTHDAQELENTVQCLQHQTQQHALNRKDLESQLRSLKGQMEAIASERDAQSRMVQELQSRLEQTFAPNFAHPISRTSYATEPTSNPQNGSNRSVASSSEPTRAGILTRQPEIRFESAPSNPELSSNPYRPTWPTVQLQSIETTLSRASELPSFSGGRNERRTRIFNPSSPSPSNASVHSTPTSSSPMRVRQDTSARDTSRVMISAPSNHFPAHNPVLVPSTSNSSNVPSSAYATPLNRFGEMGSAPPRPETPLLRRMANGHPPRS